MTCPFEVCKGKGGDYSKACNFVNYAYDLSKPLAKLGKKILLSELTKGTEAVFSNLKAKLFLLTDTEKAYNTARRLVNGKQENRRRRRVLRRNLADPPEVVDKYGDGVEENYGDPDGPMWNQNEDITMASEVSLEYSYQNMAENVRIKRDTYDRYYQQALDVGLSDANDFTNRLQSRQGLLVIKAPLSTPTHVEIL